MRAIVDTNLYELAFFPHSSQPRQRMLFKELNRRYQLLHNVVALDELLRKRSLNWLQFDSDFCRWRFWFDTANSDRAKS
jgi:hypothetical protein